MKMEARKRTRLMEERKLAAWFYMKKYVTGCLF
jgi:hypothetical protein